MAVVFGNLDVCNCLATAPTDADREASRRLVERWTRFAIEQQPGPGWPRDGLAGRVFEFGDEESVRNEFMRERMTLFINAGNLLDAALR